MDHLLIHSVVLVEPAEETDEYQNTIYNYDEGEATRTTIEAWLQQDQRSETTPDGRTIDSQLWLMITKREAISPRAHIEWADHPSGAAVFEIDGPVEPVYRPPSGFHHTEASLRLIEG